MNRSIKENMKGLIYVKNLMGKVDQSDYSYIS